MTTTSSKMLNLVTGKIYKITDFSGTQYVVRVCDKEVIRDNSHIYYCHWPHPDRNSKCNIGRHFCDSGNANQGVTIVYNVNSINTCVELSEDGAKTIGWGNKYSNILHGKTFQNKL